ncbi:MAG: iron ABC transporter permease [Spirochaeta sp.]|nr:iron ABC transporter permease [Spirochaeta sp.]
MTLRLALLFPLLVILAGLSLSLGSVRISGGDLWAALSAPFGTEETAGATTGRSDDAGETVARVIVHTVRVPRTITALGAGAALSLAGLLMQTVFRNALAGPGVLGVTSGAGLGVALVLLAGAGSGMGVPVGVAAVFGASAVLGLALVVNRVIGQPVILLVLGLLFGYAASAGTTLLMASSPAEGLERYVVWSFGSFALPPGPGPIVLLGTVILVAVVLTGSGPRLDALLLGPLYAESSGLNARSAQGLLILVSGVLTGLVTALAGPITFIGVAVPHLARGWIRSSRHTALVPTTAALGASLGVAADIVSRLPGVERVLPLNAVMALVGVPVVLSVLLRPGRRVTEEGIGL